MRRFACLAGFLVACGSNGNNVVDGGNDSSTSPLPFKPSNVSIDGFDLSHVTDEDISTNCVIQTGEGSVGGDCFTSPAIKTLVQSDGSKLFVMVVKSLRVEPTGHIEVSGGLGLVLVTLGDFNLLGTIDAHAKTDTPGPGGFTSIAYQKGAGPCGGAAGTGQNSVLGAGGGGASSCGVGGQGSLEPAATGQPGAVTPACGTPTLVPLVGGSSGGGGAELGGGGGGAVQLVAGGAFKMTAGAYINVGGGGGVFGGLATGQVAAGGGAGGSLLIEATTVDAAGTLAANGGGGGGEGGASAGAGLDGTPDSTPAPGGPPQPGGAGGAGATIDGTSAQPGGGGGGAGVGRIRINSKSGQATISAATVSPATSTACVSQGVVN